MTKETEYTMRELKSGDIFKMSKILKKIDVKVDVKKGMTQEQVGFEVIRQILENLHLAEKEVSELMGDLVGITGQEFRDLPLSKSIEIFAQFKELEGIDSFLKLANK